MNISEIFAALLACFSGYQFAESPALHNLIYYRIFRSIFHFLTSNNIITIFCAIRDGGIEIDMVVNIGKVLDEDWDYVEREIGTIVSITKRNNAILTPKGQELLNNHVLTNPLFIGSVLNLEVYQKLFFEYAHAIVLH